MEKQYNVLMVISDQHHAGLMGCAGHPQALTPQLDSFAASGVRFSNAYTQNTICTPSRVSVLSGQYCHNHGLYGLSGPTPQGLDNIFRHLKKSGYRTAAFGKLHLPVDPRNWIADDVDVFGDSYETADGYIGKSSYFEYLERKKLRPLEDSWHNTENYGQASISLDAMASKLPYEDTQERWCATETMNFIRENPRQPFCIQVALQRPHHPLLPNQRFLDLYPEDLSLPPTVNLVPEGRPPHFRRAWENFHGMKWDYAAAGEEWEAGARRVWRATLACVSQVDDVFGRLMQFLADEGLAENTIVVYHTDHGCYHGIHGIVEKAPGICSDAVCRIPFIMRVPGVTSPGSVSDALVENVDLVPTIAALCGCPMTSVDGMDLTPLLQGKTDAVHQVAVTENAWSKSIRWGKWRLVHYQREMFGRDEGELYDLENDPDETRNLYTAPAAQPTVTEMRRLLLEWLIRTTRVSTFHPAECVLEGTYLDGRHHYPVNSDGRLDNRILRKEIRERNLMYL